MIKEIELLSRVSVNHLFLAQFEAFRASLLSLRIKNPDLALGILQTVVSQGGRLDGILWSKSCSSPSHLTWLSAIELLQWNNSSSSWNLEPEIFRIKVEFLLFLHMASSKVSENIPEVLVDDANKFLQRYLDIGLQQLKFDFMIEQHIPDLVEFSFSDDELQCLRMLCINFAEIFHAICLNIQRQLNWRDTYDPGSAIISKIAEKETPRMKVFNQTCQSFQIAHLDALRECLKLGNETSAISHIQFLHLNVGVPESEYRIVLKDLIKRVHLDGKGFGSTWFSMRKRMLLIYERALSSTCTKLVSMIQEIENECLVEEMELEREANDTYFPLPLKLFNEYLQKPFSEDYCLNDNLPFRVDISCMRELYHYSRISGSHTMELIIDTAVSAIRRDQLTEASNVVSLFPLLQPLVAVMGWDLLPGKTWARKKLMQLLWATKSQALKLDEFSIFRSQSLDKVSCVEHLCDLLCYRLYFASFVACFNSGQPWNPKTSFLLPEFEENVNLKDEHCDAFAENFVLERLAVQTPLRVLFDVVPGIKFQDAVHLIKMQPLSSNFANGKRIQDIELVHMRYALESAIFAVGAMEKLMTEEFEEKHTVPSGYLADLQNHLDAISDLPRKVFIVNIIISLLHMDGVSLNLSHSSQYNDSTNSGCYIDASCKERSEMMISHMGHLLDILHHNLLSCGQIELKNALCNEALEWRLSKATNFLDDWKWRLPILQRLLPLSERKWGWKEALAILRAAPSELLNLCMQRAEYDIGEEAVHRFSLPPEDRAALDLAEWIDGAFKKSSVEDAVSRVVEGTSNSMQTLDFSFLRSQMGPIPAILLCIDVATSAAKTWEMCSQLVDEARSMQSQIYPRSSPKIGSNYWDQIQEISLMSVTKRLLQRFRDVLEQEKSPIQVILTGESFVSYSMGPTRQGHRHGAIDILYQIIEDAHKGKRQFLSGKLHNLTKAIADVEFNSKEDVSYFQKKNSAISMWNVAQGIGLNAPRSFSNTSVSRDSSARSSVYDHNKDAGIRILTPLSSKPATYLSAFLLYIATIGDIVDGTDTTHDFNFFSLVYEWPKDLLTRLIFEHGSTDAARKVADVMCSDFVREVISACVPPVYPPQSGYGWASIPLFPTFGTNIENKIFITPSREIKAPFPCSSQETPKRSLYPLHFDIVRHLAKLSPVRAVLAFVFGSSILYTFCDSCVSGSLNTTQGSQPCDTDRLFYEFALDQSERFPTLNRWIQMQSNIHRVSEAALKSGDASVSDMNQQKRKVTSKRLRDSEIDVESDVDKVVCAQGSTIFPNINAGDSTLSASWQNLPRTESVSPDNTTYYSFDWDNEGPYEKAVERLMSEGKLMDALALSDRCLHNGASDHLLQLLIEHEGETHPFPIHPSEFGGGEIWSRSWQYCLRLKDKHLAARLAIKHVHRWELDAAIDVLVMCGCHLTESDVLMDKVLQLRRDLQKYKNILSADDSFKSWLEVEAQCKEDPEGLTLRLAGKGAVSAALEVAESAGLSIDLRRELQSQQLVKLLTADPLDCGGPAEASRFLSSLPNPDDALPVAMGAIQLLPDLRSKRLLVHFFLKKRSENLSEPLMLRFNEWALGLHVLAALPLPWQQRCASLHGHPDLILEVLLMRKQLQSASLVLREFPSLRDDNLILRYAAKAISVHVNPVKELRTSVAGSRQKPKMRRGLPAISNFASSLSNLQREALRAFSWVPRDSQNKVTSKDIYRKRKSSGLSVSERVGWEAMAGIQEEQTSSYTIDGQERISTVSIDEEGWVLTGDVNKDEVVRLSHKYDTAPDIALFKELLSLCSDDLVSAKATLELCIDQMQNVLSTQKLPLHSSMEVHAQAYHATETYVQALAYCKSQLKKASVSSSSDISNNSEKSKDNDDTSSDAGSSGISNLPTDELSDLVSKADVWLRRAELLQSLLGSGIVASLNDIADQKSAEGLRDRLINGERYSMAVYTCKKCKIDAFPVWIAWGHALLRMEHYAQARVKFKQALQMYKGELLPIISEIINTIEKGPPVDVSSVRSMYEHLAKSAPTISDDSLSADAYLNILYMPTTFPRSERSRPSQENVNDQFSLSSDYDGPRSNLDNIRYLECINYLQDYARSHMLDFMFRHGHYSEACMLFFPSNSLPPQPQPSSHGNTIPAASPQRLDNLVTDYGTVDDLCDLCVGYNAMDVLEDIVSIRCASSESQDIAVSHYTFAALSRICSYCETHRHFNYLYRFQIIKQDHVAAGLTCIQLYVNSFSVEESVKHLQRAKSHFEDALLARQKHEETVKLSSKGVRGKGALEKLSEEGLVKFSSRVAIQVEIVKTFNDSEGPQWKYSLFGNPNDVETFRRRCKVVEDLVEKNFDLAFRIIYEFNLPVVDIYAAVASSLAEKKKGGQLTDLLRNIKGTIDTDDWDQVLSAAIIVYANKHKERPDRLVDMLTSSHRKVLACVICGRLKSAFQIASRSGSVADVQYVAHQALHANALQVLDMCKLWLSQYM